jgi:hypothetical protein
MVSLAISGRPSAGASALARVVFPLAGGPDTTTYLPAGRLVIAAGIHVPFFIAVGVILLGIGILGTAHSLLGEAERVQAQQVTAPVEERPAGALIPVPADITAPGSRPGAGVPAATC